MSSKKITELDKLKKPTRGRPKNKFIAHKDLWCLPYGIFCDEARSKNKCREEAPKHSMPFPFNDFDCKHYIRVPAACLEMKPEILTQLMTVAIEGAFENLFGLVNCCLIMDKIEHVSDNIYRVTFTIEYQTIKRDNKDKKIILLVDLKAGTSKLEC